MLDLNGMAEQLKKRVIKEAGYSRESKRAEGKIAATPTYTIPGSDKGKSLSNSRVAGLYSELPEQQQMELEQVWRAIAAHRGGNFEHAKKEFDATQARRKQLLAEAPVRLERKELEDRERKQKRSGPAFFHTPAEIAKLAEEIESGVKPKSKPKAHKR